MRVAILQPSYLPWLGYFEQMAFVDTFIYLDDVQYTKGDWRNRNRIKTKSGPKWLTVPVKKAATNTLIRDIEIDDSSPWRRDHGNQLRENYKTAPFFVEVFPRIEARLNEGHRLLSDLVVSLAMDIAGYLGLSAKMLRSSELGVEEPDKNGRLIALCKKMGADLLYDGKSAEDFIDREKFEREKIGVVFQNYRHPEYRQFHPPFVSHLSIVDLLFHHGPESREIVLSGH
ncbi:MAG TPA: WbqC family protein [bacterium]|nr:WbqC family protein [bacterium]